MGFPRGQGPRTQPVLHRARAQDPMGPTASIFSFGQFPPFVLKALATTHIRGFGKLIY